MFDIDKLFLATLAYDTNGNLIKEGNKNYKKESETNALLLDYIDIISDPKNFAQSRGSIDTFTEIIKDEVLPLLRDTVDDYVEGFDCLLPSFLIFRKMEFNTGKKGIGPFALNITNLALTQFAHLTIDFGKNEYNLLPLDSTYGHDGKLIAGWLSAMVNAHVDVAKDPYIFTLNVNQVTYNMCNFLLRTGNGKATFAFLAQPIIREFAQKLNDRGGIYGQNLYGDDSQSAQTKGTISKNLQQLYVNRLANTLKELSARNISYDDNLNKIWAHFSYEFLSYK